MEQFSECKVTVLHSLSSWWFSIVYPLRHREEVKGWKEEMKSKIREKHARPVA